MRRLRRERGTGYHHARFHRCRRRKFLIACCPISRTSRPLERFWPYSDLAEQPSDEELAKVDPDLREALFGPLNLPFSVSLVFPRFRRRAITRARSQLARASDEYFAIGVWRRTSGTARASITGDRPMRLRDLYLIVAAVPGWMC